MAVSSFILSQFPITWLKVMYYTLYSDLVQCPIQIIVMNRYTVSQISTEPRFTVTTLPTNLCHTIISRYLFMTYFPTTYFCIFTTFLHYVGMICSTFQNNMLKLFWISYKKKCACKTFPWFPFYDEEDSSLGFIKAVSLRRTDWINFWPTPHMIYSCYGA